MGQVSPAQDRRGKQVSETDGSAWSHHFPQRTWAQHCQQALSVKVREFVTLTQYLCRMLGDGINHLSQLEELAYPTNGANSARCHCAYSATCHGANSARCHGAYSAKCHCAYYSGRGKFMPQHLYMLF
jgi:hypothetical protein